MEVIVEFDYAAEESDELNIKKGDIIKDVSQFEEGWFIGSLNGKIGVFPDNFVKVISSMQPKISPIVIAEPIKEASNNDVKTNNESLTGANIISKPKPVVGVGLGNIFSGQQIHLKQTALREVAKNNEATTPTDKSLKNCKSKDETGMVSSVECVRVRYNYSPKQPDELELHMDDVIEVIDRNLPDDGWWKGKNLRTKLTGVFPDNFVVPIENYRKKSDDLINQNQLLSTSPSPDSKNMGTKAITLQNGSAGEINRSPRSVLSTNAHNVSSDQDNVTTTTTTTSNNQSVSHVNGTSNIEYVKPGVRPSAIAAANKVLTKSDNPPSATSNITVGKANTDNKDTNKLPGFPIERPKQSGRRLPTKLSTLSNLTGDDENQNLTSEQISSQLFKSLNDQSTVENIKTHVINRSDQVNRTINDGLVKQDDKIRHNSTAGVVRGKFEGGIHTAESKHPSSELTNNAAATLNKQNTVLNNNNNNNQHPSTQSEVNNLLTEMRQQMCDLKTQYESLKESHAQFLSGWVKSQKILTDRIQMLMDELDETKKLRASDAIELARLKFVLKQIDTNNMLCVSTDRQLLSINHKLQTQNSNDKSLDNHINARLQTKKLSNSGNQIEVSTTSPHTPSTDSITNDTHTENNKTVTKPTQRTRPHTMQNVPALRPLN